MKKLFLAIGIIIIVAFTSYVGFFVWKNLHGIASKPGIDVIVGFPDIFDYHRKSSKVSPPGANTTGMPLTLPSGFSISVFAKGLGKPRVITKDNRGNLLVSIPSQGKVVALSDDNGDGVSDRTTTVVSGLNRPHGLVFDCRDTPVAMPVARCHLFVAEADQVARFDYDEWKLTATKKQKLFDLPGAGEHMTRTLLASPTDERLLVSVGSTCNACEEKDWRRAAISITNQAGTALEPFASGLRNSVFMTIQPGTGKIWATEMGRDFLGDDLPPDELNIIEKGFYGWPYCYGRNEQDTKFDAGEQAEKICANAVPPNLYLPAHSAPLGLAFIPRDVGWPMDYEGGLLVAFHGSSNRSVPTGYSIAYLPFYGDRKESNIGGPFDFISGWLRRPDVTSEVGVPIEASGQHYEALGRPVDLFFDGGILYISDDKAGVIYRVTYR